MAQRCVSCSCLWSVILLVVSAGLTSAQDEGTCYGPGSMATGIILSILFTALLLVGLYLWWKKYRARQEHLMLETDPEKGKAEFAFDNPGFKDAGFTPVSKSSEKNKLETNKTKWNQWSPLSALTTKYEKQRRTVDDSAIEGSEVKVVALRSHDFTGLGFNICGNMKDGIYIKDVLHRGPASESGKLNPGDRINSVTISFEHMVYEDALTILSYASPYEIIIEAKSGKIISNTSGQGGQPSHPVYYRSSSCTDLFNVEKSSKRRLFGDDFNGSLSSNYSSLQKSRSNMTTLERKESKSPKVQITPKKPAPKTHLSPDQLKIQLEQKIISDHQQNLKMKNEKPVRIENESQKTENKFQKFGIRVLPMDLQQRSPKSAELSQNDNNINIEKQDDSRAIDEVDNKKIAPQAKKREKKATPDKPDEFVRQNSLNSSGIKRDANGIPQEIPSHMFNAAVAARKNRKNSEDRTLNIDDENDTSKTPRKVKPKAPPPPEEKKVEKTISKSSFDEIETVPDNVTDTNAKIAEKNEKTPSEMNDSEGELRSKESKEYNSDSDIETDNKSSVNTIELNSSDITIHQTEESDDRQSRRTASTGDLTKMQRIRKTSTGTLERAQSLDITDTGIPSLSKKRKAGRIEDTYQSDEDIFGNLMLNKEPRLSLILDGLSTFQRNRLKKSTEWGNLEDAILKLNQEDENKSFDASITIEDLRIDFPDGSPELTAVVGKIKEIKRQSLESEYDDRIQIDNLHDLQNKTENIIQNQIWPSDNEITDIIDVSSKRQIVRKPNDCVPFPMELEEKQNIEDETVELKTHPTSHQTNFVLHQKDVAPKVSSSNKRQQAIVDSVPEKVELYTEEQPISYIELDTKQFTLDNKQYVGKPVSEKTQYSSITTIHGNQDEVDGCDVNKTSEVNNTAIPVNAEISLGANRNEDKDSPVPKPTSLTNVNTPDEIKTNVTFTNTSPVPDTLDLTERFLTNEKSSYDQDVYNPVKYDTNISDDIKVSRHTLNSLEKAQPYNCISVSSSSPSSLKNISNVIVNNENASSGLPSLEVNVNEQSVRTNDTTSDNSLYTTALDTTARENKTDISKIMISTPDLIKNVSITEAINSLNNDITIQGPSSLSLSSPKEKVEVTENKFSTVTTNIRKFDSPEENKPLKRTSSSENISKNNSTLTYITEIQVTPTTKNISEIEIIPNSNTTEKNGRNLDNEFENYVKNFESNVKSFETNIRDFESNLSTSPKNETDSLVITEKIDVEKELHKIQEIAEEQLKKLPEMRFTTSSYESSSRIPEKRQSQIELLRSNFEKSPPKLTKTDSTTKSRIPISTTMKTPPMSPERRDSRNFDLEQDKAILDLMSSTIHSTPLPPKHQNKTPNKNITVTSIRTSSKIPSGLPTLSSGRPPIPPRKYESNENDNIIQVSTNGGTESSFKQWVFNPNDSVTNIVVTQNKHDQK